MKNSQLSNSLIEDKVVIVPQGVTIGLVIFAIILGLAGFGFRLAIGEHFADILPNLLLTIGIFWVGVPVFFVVGSMVLNRFSNKPPIHWKNAVTLGLLFSCVSMLWLMSAYS